MGNVYNQNGKLVLGNNSKTTAGLHANVGVNGSSPNMNVTDEEKEELRKQVKKLTEEKNELLKSFNLLKSENAELKKDNKKLRAEVTNLNTRVSRLEKDKKNAEKEMEGKIEAMLERKLNMKLNGILNNAPESPEPVAPIKSK
jgi:predicted nuclease with TOPRIM domain